MARKRIRSVVKIIVEVSVWLAMSVLTMLLAYNVIGVEPTRRGFFCDDETLQYPYRDDTVSDTMVAVLFILVPICIMIIVECLHLLSSKERQAKGEKVLLARKLPGKIYKTVGAFLFAAMITMFLTETMKLFGGRLRPHFLTVCSPNFSKINCTQGFVIISDQTCTSGATQQKLLDARKSFPSGHASVSVFGAIYFIIYLHIRFIWTKQIRVILPLIQVGIVCGTAYVCISRVNDNKHHYSDVIAGALLGTIVALLMIKYVSCLPRKVSRGLYNLHDLHGKMLDVSLQKCSLSSQNSNCTMVEIKDI